MRAELQVLADQKRHLPFASFCNTGTVSSACQDLQSRAAAHQRSNFPQKPVPEHVTPKISGKDLALHNHSTDFDSMFRSVGKKSDKRGFKLLYDLLRPTATCGTFLAGSPQTRPSSSWLVLACHAECSSEVAQCRRSPTHLHGLQPFLESLKTDSQVPMNQEPP